LPFAFPAAGMACWYRMAIPWNDTYSVGVAEIDAQHRQYFAILNDLYEAVYGMKPKDVLSRIFDELIEYARVHFATEETYFDRFGYEGTAEHTAEHRKFLEKVTDMRTRYSQDRFELTRNLVEFMEDWLVEHLSTMDKKYVQCFHDHGLT
jgi:hemerythrin